MRRVRTGRKPPPKSRSCTATWPRPGQRKSAAESLPLTSRTTAGLPGLPLRGLRHLVRCLHQVRLFAFLLTHRVHLLFVMLDLLGVGEVLVAYVALHDSCL